MSHRSTKAPCFLPKVLLWETPSAVQKYIHTINVLLPFWEILDKKYKPPYQDVIITSIQSFCWKKKYKEQESTSLSIRKCARAILCKAVVWKGPGIQSLCWNTGNTERQNNKRWLSAEYTEKKRNNMKHTETMQVAGPMAVGLWIAGAVPCTSALTASCQPTCAQPCFFY